MFSAPLRRVLAKAKRAMNGHRVKRNVRRASRHISGPARIRLAPDQVACVCMVKNAASYLDVLLDHHRARGVSHFLFIDNGSEDDTLVRLQLEPDVTVIATIFPSPNTRRNCAAISRAGISRVAGSCSSIAMN